MVVNCIIVNMYVLYFNSVIIVCFIVVMKLDNKKIRFYVFMLNDN